MQNEKQFGEHNVLAFHDLQPEISNLKSFSPLGNAIMNVGAFFELRHL
jgi:hypothetical protein